MAPRLEINCGGVIHSSRLCLADQQQSMSPAANETGSMIESHKATSKDKPDSKIQTMSASLETGSEDGAMAKKGCNSKILGSSQVPSGPSRRYRPTPGLINLFRQNRAILQEP
jgi:hypothetical protein